MTDNIFVDSNLWVYLFTDDDDTKSKAVKKYITKCAENNRLVISYQIVNEVCSVLKKKNYSEFDIRRVAGDMMGLCDVCDYSGEIVFKASDLRARYSFAYWDSHVVASALTSQCGVLASEDMQDGLKIDSLTIMNVLKVSH